MRWLRAFRRRRTRDRDTQKELAFHLEEQIADYVAAGMPHDEAVRRARLELGGLQQIMEASMDASVLGRFNAIGRDFRFALRMFRRMPVFALACALMLALGIAGTVAVYSVVDTLLLRALPYRDADRIVTVSQTSREGRADEDEVAPGAFLDWRERSTTFSVLAAADPSSFRYLASSEPMTLLGARVTEGFFDALGVEPLLGRKFDPGEHVQGRSDVILVSYGAWQRHFGGDPAIVGRKVVLDGRPYLVAGVLPRWFHADVLHRAREQEIWAPKVVQDFEYEQRRSRYWGVVGRLAPGSSIERAQAELLTISTQLATEYPRTMGGTVATIVPFRQHLAGRIQEPLIALSGGVLLVLLIACANVASLLIARGAERQREFAIRVAIGAGRWQLVRQMLVESVILAAIACGIGVALAYFAINAFVALGQMAAPQLNELALDWRVMAFAILLAGGTALLFGLWPALQLSKPAAHGTVHESSIGVTASSARRRFGSALVVAEVALALVLLVGAGLLVRSFVTLIRVDPGFVRSNVTVLQVFAYGTQYRTDAQRRAFFDQALAQIRSLPGIQNAGLVSAMPFIPANIDIEGGFRVEGRPEPPPNELPSTHLSVTTADYFRAMRIPLRSGRLFADTDQASTPQVALINDMMAQRFWPTENPLGQHITVNWQGRWRTMEVVGVVGRMRHDGLDFDPRPEVFMPFSQLPFGSMTFVVRSSADPATLIPALKARIWTVDPTLPFYDIATVDALVSQSLASRRSITQLLSGLAGLAFLLAAAGIYGVLSFSIARRTRELGVRIAMGAEAKDIFRLVLGEGMMLVGAGVVFGLAGAFVATRVLGALLYNVSPTDPLTLAGTTALLFAVAMLACYVPARRATRVDPLLALRVD
jgi:putative ABC transport system permease protein